MHLKLHVTNSQQLPEREDDALMILAKRGVERAFDELVRRHQARVARVAFKYLGCDALAAEVVQEVFWEIYQRRDHYKPKGLFRAYLYRTTLNRCHSVRRSARRKNENLAKLQHESPDGATSPDELLIAEERRREIERALTRLSEKLRRVVILRFAADLSYQEIADALKIPLGTVKRRLFDGTAALRKELER
jgi:RNA polymerase sigma-70 factor (ECF subfamily)